ncbi:hypothetical protein BSKO_11586 [Bryopsis sp. KO-2023]|nr:hypothetical protein BSKO_11586 [Bryopsis sp. KO-2023]
MSGWIRNRIFRSGLGQGNVSYRNRSWIRSAYSSEGGRGFLWAIFPSHEKRYRALLVEKKRGSAVLPFVRSGCTGRFPRKKVKKVTMEAFVARNSSLLYAAPIKSKYRQPHMRKLQNNIKSMLVRRRSLERKPLLEIDEPRDPDFAKKPTTTGRSLRRLVTSIKTRFNAASTKPSAEELILFSELSEVSDQSNDGKLRAEYDIQVSECVDSAFGEDFDDFTPLLGDENVGGKAKGLKKRASKVKAALSRKLSRGGKMKYAFACCPLTLRKRNGYDGKTRYDQQNTGSSWDSGRSL